MRVFAANNGCRDLVGSGGKHHEIHMSDPRRVNPEKLKTASRQPVWYLPTTRKKRSLTLMGRIRECALRARYG